MCKDDNKKNMSSIFDCYDLELKDLSKSQSSMIIWPKWLAFLDVVLWSRRKFENRLGNIFQLFINIQLIM